MHTAAYPRPEKPSWKIAGLAAAVLAALLAVLIAGCGEDDHFSPPPANTQLGSTPPMGWNSWNHFHCSVNEQIVREVTDAIVASGMRDAGYVFVNIDDCWAYDRDATGALRADPQTFSSGIAPLADYAHARGLKLGIYGSPGSHTCAGRIGSLGHVAQDAQTFAAWGIDYLKYDWCGADKDGLEEIAAYTDMGEALRATGRPIVYSLCEYGQRKPWLWGRSTGAQLWRTTGDILDIWEAVRYTIFIQPNLLRYTGPGGWNDPDMLEVGNGGMSDSEYRVHFSMWALFNAPLLAGNDPRTMTPETKEILLNREIIAVDQDWGGTAAFKLRDDGDVEVWEKPMSDGSVVVALLNQADQTADISVTATALGLPPSTAYRTRDLWAHTESTFTTTLQASVPRHAVAMFRVRAD